VKVEIVLGVVVLTDDRLAVRNTQAWLGCGPAGHGGEPCLQRIDLANQRVGAGGPAHQGDGRCAHNRISPIAAAAWRRAQRPVQRPIQRLVQPSALDQGCASRYAPRPGGFPAAAEG